MHKMSEKKKLHHLDELKEMIQKKKPEETTEEVLAKFCSRHALPMSTCKTYYNELAGKGETKEK